ncbi:cytidylate kinase [Acidimicrobiaceae bacterium]|nr:cytidylate kinase [Acidimicrobiaceae bacterium]
MTRVARKTPVGDVDAPMIVVAIDGPAGAGKSTIAKALAAKLGVRYLDTGAMYRAVTFAAMNSGIELSNQDFVAELTRRSKMSLTDDSVVINGLDVTTAIRSSEVTAAVSSVASNSQVRTELRERQRQWIAEHNGGVVEGRDIGSVVFPDATLKVYLTASPIVRAKRRVAQSGGDVDEIAAAIASRDLQDSSRSDSPLTQTDDAVTIDTSDRSIDQVVAELVEMTNKRSNEKSSKRS